MSSNKISCSQTFRANLRANKLKLRWVEKYLRQEKYTIIFAYKFIVNVLSRFVAENSSVTNPAFGNLKIKRHFLSMTQLYLPFHRVYLALQHDAGCCGFGCSFFGQAGPQSQI